MTGTVRAGPVLGVGSFHCGTLAAGAPAQAPLTLALTPALDPTALKEAGDAFAGTIPQTSGAPVRTFVASGYHGEIEGLRSRRIELTFVHPLACVPDQ